MASRGGATRPNGPNAGNKICQFKLVLLGESAVGKSSLVLRFVKGQFHEFQESTIGGMLSFTFCTKTLSKETTLGSWYFWHLLYYYYQDYYSVSYHQCYHVNPPLGLNVFSYFSSPHIY